MNLVVEPAAIKKTDLIILSGNFLPVGMLLKRYSNLMKLCHDFGLGKNIKRIDECCTHL